MADKQEESEEMGDTQEQTDEDMEYVAEDDTDDENNETENGTDETKVYLPTHGVQADEELVMDESAYIMYHQAQTGAPCLSFDILRDHLGENRQEYPHTMYLVAGTQAEKSLANSIIIMKMANLKKTTTDTEKNDDNSDSDSESEDEDDKPELDTAMIKHQGGVNRVKCVQVDNCNLAASWSEQGRVHIWDLTRPLQAVNDFCVMAEYTRNQESPKALFTFTGHLKEGFALDWSSTKPGRLLTGDCNKFIHLWEPQSGGKWHVDQRPYTGHTDSVEDIQWSPNEANVFASCSVDKSIRIWDVRSSPGKACMLTTSNAHESDVNVISWNRHDPFIVSGGDDGVIKIWDLRQFKHGKSVAIFKHHAAPITSVEWHPQDSTVFAASGSDDQITLWDLSVERDTDTNVADAEEPAVPPQLLFIHQGQHDIKELHWHPQIPGAIISTAHSGLNVFRTISV